MRRTGLRRRARRRGGESAALKDELDDLARTAVMLRAGAAIFEDVPGRKSWFGSCQRCGRPDWLSWCHVVTRATWVVRWDLDNSFAWCRGCHRHLDQHWTEKALWVADRIGDNAFDALVFRASTGQKPDLQAIRLYLLAQTVRIREGRRASDG